jgi:hypothetical protein
MLVVLAWGLGVFGFLFLAIGVVGAGLTVIGTRAPKPVGHPSWQRCRPHVSSEGFD